jgi:hypothetical protein
MGNIFVKRGLGTWQKRQATPTASNSTQQATIKEEHNGTGWITEVVKTAITKSFLSLPLLY